MSSNGKIVVIMIFLLCGFEVIYVTWREDVFSDREARLQVLGSQLSKHILNQPNNDTVVDEQVELGWLVNAFNGTTQKVSRIISSKDDTVKIPRSVEYCNPMYNMSEGSEGRLGKYQLVNVHIVIRHGDRSPIYILPNQPSPKLSCQMVSHLDAENITDKYLQFISNIKQSHLKMYPLQKQCEGSQLTPRGFYQHFRAGKYLSKIYISKRHLFGKYLNMTDWKDSVYVRTTHYSRTYQSAWAFLYGFLSNVTTADKINMITESYATNFCSSHLSGVSCYCPLVGSLETILGKEHNKIAHNNTLYKSVKQAASKVLGISVLTVPWIGAILDVLMAYTCHEQQLPCISKTKQCFTSKLVKNMWTASDSVNKAELKSKTKLKYNDLMMHPLMREIANRYVNITQGISKQKFVLYSGHDKTLTPLTVALGVNDGKWPPYASRLVFELYNNPVDGKYFLRVVYNGKDVTRKLRFCDRIITRGLCPLKNYLDFVFHKQLNSYGTGGYKNICTI